LLDILVHAYQPDASEAAKWHSMGHAIFNYADPQSAAENPFLWRLNYGLLLWANDYDGAMPYAYQDCAGSCWNHIDPPVYRDHCLTYPTADGVIDTLAWEGFREAINDVRYIATLEDLLYRKDNQGSPTAVEADSYLKKPKSDIQMKQKNSGKFNQGMDIDLDGVRSRIMNYIVRFENKEKTPL
jgi:hypothetical protein